MQAPPIPPDEDRRLATLARLAGLDSTDEARFDRLTRLALRLFQVPIALVSLVDAERVWFKSRQGFQRHEIPRDISFCGHAILDDDIFLVTDTQLDPRFADNPLVIGDAAIRFYAGAPLHAPDGERIGVLCVLDRQARELDREARAALRDLADTLEAELARPTGPTKQHAQAREAGEDQARESARLLDSVIENLPLMLFLKRASDLRLVMLNRAGERMTGYPRETLLGRGDRDVFPAEEAALFERKDRQVLAGSGFEEIPEETLTRRDGSQLILHTKKVAIRDAAGRPQYLLGISEDVTQRRQDAQRIAEQNHLLDAISRAQSRFIQNADFHETFDGVLGDLLRLTHSEYGFIGEVLQRADGAPYLKTYALTNIAWDDDTRAFYAENAPHGLEFSNLSTLFGWTLKTGEVVIANTPDQDPRRGGLPDGHPPLDAFLGLPLYKGDQLVGMAGLANRPGGYSPELVEYLAPLSRTLGTLIDARRADVSLKRGEAHIRAVLETVMDGIISIDARGVIQTVNPAAEKIFGYSRDEMRGRNVSMLMPEPYRSAHDGYLANYLGGGVKKIIGIGREVEGQRKDGECFPMELAVSETQVLGERMFTGVVRDITERQKLDRMKSEFVSTVSHELRTPLTSIRGALGLVVGRHADALPDKARQMLEMAERNSARLTVLINDLLDLEKIETGRLEFTFGPLDLTQLAHQALEANEGYARGHGIRLSLAGLPAEAPVRGDAHRLMQVFANLISNAVKFSPPEGEVAMGVEPIPGGFRIRVRDRGPGIPESFRHRVFQRFAQADSSDSRQKGGTGLGLSITKAIVDKHEGRIDYITPADGGTEFQVDLPLWRETSLDAAGDGRPATVLICEDNPDVAAVLAALLEEEDLVCDIAATGAAARTLLASRRYRLMLLDLSLPDTDGLELLRELRHRPDTRSLPVIVVSGRAEEGRAMSGAGLQVIDWLRKPVDTERLSTALEQALGQSTRPCILHVEDDPDIIRLTRLLVRDLAEYACASSLEEARAWLTGHAVDLVLLDLTLPDGSGLELIEELKGRAPVLVFSGQEPGQQIADRVAAALNKGRTSAEELLATLRRIIEKQEHRA